MIYLAKRQANGGIIGGFRDIGDADKLEIDANQKYDDIEESRSGLRQVAAHTLIGTSYAMKLNALDFRLDNLADFTYGTSTGQVTGSTVTAEAITAYYNSMCPLQNPGVSAVAVKSGATPLVEGTDYTVDAANGCLTFLPTSTIVTSAAAANGIALTVDYTFASYTGTVEAATRGAQEFCVRLNGLNTANGNAPVIVTLHRVALDMTKVLDLLNNKHGNMEVDGMLLPDMTQPAGKSQYYSVTKV